jgi:hypothetical protein
MIMRKVIFAVAALSACVCLALGAGAAARQALLEPPADEKVQKSAAPKPDRAASARVDAAGDPLPKEAAARLGSTRLKHGQFYIGNMFLTPNGKTLISQSYGETFAWEVLTGRQLRRFPKEAQPGNWHGASLPDQVGDLRRVKRWCGALSIVQHCDASSCGHVGDNLPIAGRCS